MLSTSLFLLIANSLAATWTVNPSGGGTHTTITAAITASASGDTITVANGTYAENLDTRRRSITIRAATGASPVVAPSSGIGLSLSRGESVRVEGLIFRGADQGIQVRGSTLTLVDSRLEDNLGAASGAGLGVFEGAMVTVESCVFDGNRALSGYEGGAIHVDASSLSATDTQILSGTARQGAGLFAHGSEVSLDGVVFTDNAATQRGGAIFLEGGSSLTGTDVEMNDNTAGTRGGGVSAVDSDLSLEGGTVSGNQAGSAGGGLAIEGFGTTGSLLSGLLIEENEAVGNGGGLLVEESPLQGLNLVVSGNTAGAAGGGASLSGSAFVLDGGEFGANVAAEGGGIWAGIGTSGVGALELVGLRFEANTSTGDGGGLWSEIEVDATDLESQSNEATGDGGGMLLMGDGILSGWSCTGDTAGSSGGCLCFDGDNLTISGLVAQDGQADYGGGLALSGGVVSLHTLEMQGGTATDGGQIWAYGLDSLAGEGLILQGGVASGNGGGLSAQAVGSLDLSGLLATGGLANVGGGALRLKDVMGNLRYAEIGGNQAAFGGGLIIETPRGELRVANSLAWENEAETGAGILVQNATAGRVMLDQVSVLANTGPGISLRGSSGNELHNCVLEANSGAGVEADEAEADGAVAYCMSGNNGNSWGGLLGDLTGTLGNTEYRCNHAALSRDSNTENDLASFGSPSNCRDAGDPGMEDLDGSRSDPGWQGGPEALDGDDDGDGWARSRGDCADADDASYPGAPENWYDGIDQDCAGDNDYDADADGIESPADCADADPNVHPGQADETADGIDHDCDGEDGPAGEDGSDGGGDGAEGTDGGGGGAVDRDQDGSPEGEDCRDTDPTVYPGAVEECGDGLDNDCDGASDANDLDCGGKAAAGCASAGANAGALLALLGFFLSFGRHARSRP